MSSASMSMSIESNEAARMTNARQAHQGLAWFAALLVVASMTLYLVDWLSRPNLYGLSHVVIDGQLTQTDTDALHEALSRSLHGNYFAVDMRKIEAVMAAYPWVSHFSVRKQWPNTLRVMLEEYQPVAKWGDGRWLSSGGRVLTLGQPLVADNAAVLPTLSGSEDSAGEVWATYQRWNPRLNRIGLTMQSLHFSPGKTWTAHVVGLDGVEGAGSAERVAFELKLLNENADAQLATGMSALNSHLYSRWTMLERVDLRYHHGFAVQWRNEAISRGENLE